jgi:hypothetical protein
MAAFEIAAGIFVVIATGVSLAATFILPRGKSFGLRLALWVNRSVRWTVVQAARPIRDFARKDSVLAVMGPFALLTQLALFLTMFMIGFAIALTPYAPSFAGAVKIAASDVFSVGIAHVSGPGNSALEVLGAVTGAVAIALQIGYLPALYQAFNRRESLVTLMESRSGLPAWGPELLMRHQLIGSLDALPELYRDWEVWSADLAESHVSYPILLLFRSPQPGYSYALALLSILDAAALHLSLMPGSAPSEARFCLRMGFTALRRIAETLGWPVVDDPLPGDEIELTFEEFSYAVEMLSNTGLPLERDAEAAWPHFRGWRVNYEALAYRLAERTIAPHVPWSGDRRNLGTQVMMPRRPPHRQPDGKVTDSAGHRPPVAAPAGAAGRRRRR